MDNNWMNLKCFDLSASIPALFFRNIVLEEKINGTNSLKPNKLNKKVEK
jgi:hypothetical protein